MPLLRITRIRFAADRVDRAVPVFAERSRSIAGEPGCLAISFGQLVDDPRSAVAVSAWADDESHAAHERTESYASFAEAVASGGLIEGEPEIRVYEAPVFVIR